MNKYLVPVYYVVEASSTSEAELLVQRQMGVGPATTVSKPAILIDDKDLPIISHHRPGL